MSYLKKSSQPWISLELQWALSRILRSATADVGACASKMAVRQILSLALLSGVALAAPKPDDNNGWCPPASTITKTVTAPASTMTVTSGGGSGSGSSASSGSSTSSGTPSPTTTETATYTGVLGLNDYARATGKLYFGIAADIPGPEQQDQYYIAELENFHDWGQMTPANYMKVSVDKTS